mmetsp:Transcript_48802/g.137936  ORF Transcript_48802/g.137936 Transcript_48802/m.137936 type:complete len:260 (-) Transcript_48802:2-781(-)
MTWFALPALRGPGAGGEGCWDAASAAGADSCAAFLGADALCSTALGAAAPFDGAGAWAAAAPAPACPAGLAAGFAPFPAAFPAPSPLPAEVVDGFPPAPLTGIGTDRGGPSCVLRHTKAALFWALSLARYHSALLGLSLRSAGSRKYDSPHQRRSVALLYASLNFLAPPAFLRTQPQDVSPVNSNSYVSLRSLSLAQTPPKHRLMPSSDMCRALVRSPNQCGQGATDGAVAVAHSMTTRELPRGGWHLAWCALRRAGTA